MYVYPNLYLVFVIKFHKYQKTKESDTLMEFFLVLQGSTPMQRKYQDGVETGKRELALAVVQWESIKSLVIGVVSTIQDTLRVI